jgi:lysophospholipase L1-like esterase
VKKITIATLGTSLTAGIQPSYSWQRNLHVSLQSGKSLGSVVLNYGVSGASSSVGLSSLEELIHSRPDIVLIEFSVNDAYSPYSITTEQSKSNIEQIVELMRADNPLVKICLTILNPPVPGSSASTSRPNYADYKAVYYDLASEDEGLVLIDCSSSWGAPTLEQIPDGLHPPVDQFNAVSLPVITNALLPLIY